MLLQFISKLTTARLLLRPMTIEDAPALFALRSRPEVVRYTGAGHESLQQSEDYIRRMEESARAGEDYAWGLARRDEPEKMLGLVCLWNRQPDGSMFVGYELQPESWGRGYMGEALEAVLACCFDALELPRVLADPMGENRASIALLTSLGFVLVDSFLRPDGNGLRRRHLLYERRPQGVFLASEEERVGCPLACVPVEEVHAEKVKQFIAARGRLVRQALRGELCDLSRQRGMMTLEGEAIRGLLLYRMLGEAWEVLMLESLEGDWGLEGELLRRVCLLALEAGARRITVIVTNDNTDAMAFYQKRGFEMVAFYPNALADARKREPSIPAMGRNGVPMRHELEFALTLYPD